MHRTHEATAVAPAPAGLERGAVAVIVNSAGEILLHLRDDIDEITWPGHWSLLGGSCEPGEAPADAIARELQEEAALEPNDLVERFDVLDQYGSGKMITFFVGRWDGDEKALPLSEGVTLQFFPIDQFPGLTIPPYIRDGIHRALADQRT